MFYKKEWERWKTKDGGLKDLLNKINMSSSKFMPHTFSEVQFVCIRACVHSSIAITLFFRVVLFHVWELIQDTSVWWNEGINFPFCLSTVCHLRACRKLTYFLWTVLLYWPGPMKGYSSSILFLSNIKCFVSSRVTFCCLERFLSLERLCYKVNKGTVDKKF